MLYRTQMMCAAVGLSVALVIPLFSQEAHKAPSAQQALATFDRANPGRGSDFYSGDNTEQAMAYAVYASAAALVRDVEGVRIAADWLVAHGRRSEATGWGIGTEWDAFSDGSKNPADAIYGVTTAWGVRALLDAYELTGDVRYGRTALDALDYYKRFFTETPDGGYFWYSDQPSDRKMVHNISAMLLGQFARAGKMWSRPDLLQLARKAFDCVWTRRHSGDLGTYWYYGEGTEYYNDSVHAAYIAQGLHEFSKAAGHQINFAPVRKYLTAFLENGKVREFARHPDLRADMVDRVARVWGVGMLIFTLTEVGLREEAHRFEAALRAYEFAPGRFGLVPGQTALMVRMQSHVALGLARLQQ